MISTALLSEVLGVNVVNEPEVLKDFPSFVYYDVDFKDNTVRLNIYELAHKCKEWAKSNEYSINSGNRLDDTSRYDVVCVHKDTDIEEWDDFFSGMFGTEPEAIFKACEYILEQKANNER